VSTFSFVYLASQSPRRAQLLDQLGVAHRPLLPGPDEDAEALERTRAGESPEGYVQRVTRAKLRAARMRLDALGSVEAPILCADTTVALGRSILGKPADANEARAMLRRLSGRTHRVCTAVAVGVPATGRTHAALQVSRVHVAALREVDIDDYVDSGEPFGKAGAYAIQGRFAAHVTRVAGSHSAIMGLPLHETWRLLRRAHVIATR
jgi:septum formation protein